MRSSVRCSGKLECITLDLPSKERDNAHGPTIADMRSVRLALEQHYLGNGQAKVGWQDEPRCLAASLRRTQGLVSVSVPANPEAGLIGSYTDRNDEPILALVVHDAIELPAIYRGAYIVW